MTGINLRGTLPVMTAEEMRSWEAACFDELHISERVVLESAGRAVAHEVLRAFPDGRVIGVVGRGKNGGDAVVALRTLKAHGREVAAVSVGGAELARDLLHEWSVPPVESSEFGGAAVLLDGILGTGARGAPRSAEAAVIREMNQSGTPIVAIDGPSGVDLTSGAVEGEAVEARLTITFGALKRGLLLHPGRRFAGRILVAEVGFPPLDPGTPAAFAPTDSWAATILPRIPPDAHKGGVGIVAVIAGRTGFGGAAIMAAMGALRAGAGGVRVVSTGSNRGPTHAAVPEAVFIDRDDATSLELIQGTRAMLIGPGIGTDDAARSLLSRIVKDHSAPLVIDADALTLLSREPDLLPPARARGCVLTPHPGELARLLEMEIPDVLADRIGSATAAADRFGCAVLAKGAPSIVVAPDSPPIIGVSGHSGVATGGMGDTLGGVIATLIAQGLDPVTGAALGVHLAGRAAEMAGRGRGLLPRDVAEALPDVIRALENGAAGAVSPFLMDLAAAY